MLGFTSFNPTYDLQIFAIFFMQYWGSSVHCQEIRGLLRWIKR